MKKVLRVCRKKCILSLSQTNTPMTAIPHTLSTSDVQNLEFLRISDDICPNKWVEWEVRFDYHGLSCVGFLGGCPFRPNLVHDTAIEGCEA